MRSAAAAEGEKKSDIGNLVALKSKPQVAASREPSKKGVLQSLLPRDVTTASLYKRELSPLN